MTDGNRIYDKQSNWIQLNNYLAYRIKNGILMIQGNSSNTKVIIANTYTNLGDLPVGYRPSVDTDHPLTFLGGTQIGFVRIRTDGSISAYVNSSTGYWAFFACID